MTDLLLPGVASPFDAIRRTRPDGSEYWAGRDLMAPLGYGADWRNFTAAADRARVAAANQGHDPKGHFVGVTEMVKSGIADRPREDVHLTRFAAYLVAMNGDPRKPEVAAAQAYFAVKTREAEIAKPMTREELLSRAFLEATAALAEKDERIAELEPQAEVASKLLDADGDLSVADAAKSLTRAGIKVGAQRLFTALSDRYGWIFRAKGDGRWRVAQTAIEAGWMSVIPQSHYHPKTGVLVLDPPQPRVTPKGLQRLLNDHGAGS